MENAAPVLQTKSFIHNEWIGNESNPTLIVKNKFLFVSCFFSSFSYTNTSYFFGTFY